MIEEELILDCGYGEVIVKIEIKDRKVVYLEFESKERVKIDY